MGDALRRWAGDLSQAQRVVVIAGAAIVLWAVGRVLLPIEVETAGGPTSGCSPALASAFQKDEPMAAPPFFGGEDLDVSCADLGRRQLVHSAVTAMFAGLGTWLALALLGVSAPDRAAVGDGWAPPDEAPPGAGAAPVPSAGQFAPRPAPEPDDDRWAPG